MDYKQTFMDGTAYVRETTSPEGKPVTLVEVEDLEGHYYHLSIEGHKVSYSMLIWNIYKKLNWVIE